VSTAGVRDYLWAAVAGLVVAAFLVGLASVLWDVANARGFSRALAIPVGLVSASLLATWAWRRTVWGRRPAE
jgi:hypothetical protein